MNPKLDEDMVKLAKRLGKDRYDVFSSAMALYIALKNRQLEELEKENENLNLPLHVFLENGNNKKFEFISKAY